MPHFGNEWTKIKQTFNATAIRCLETRIALRRSLLLVNLNQVIMVAGEACRKNVLFRVFTSCARRLPAGTHCLFQNLNVWAHLFSIRTVLALIIGFAFHDPRTPSGIERNIGKIPLIFGVSFSLKAARMCGHADTLALFPRPLLGNLRAVTEEELKQLGLTTRA